MPAALPLTELIDQSATRKRTQRVLVADYGDGYTHETPDGANSQLDMWSNVTWPNLTESQRDTVVAVLDAVGLTDYVTWTPPGDTSKRFKVTADGYTESFPAGHLYTISLSLRQIV